jgi:hypothetical protein
VNTKKERSLGIELDLGRATGKRCWLKKAQLRTLYYYRSHIIAASAFGAVRRR